MDDGYIRMMLKPEDSNGGLGAHDLPYKKTTEVTTNILVKDGHTIVIGGLFRDRTTLGRSQLPILGNIPLLGHLFRSSSDQNRKEEVIFLITPHIIKDNVDYAAADALMAKSDQLLLGIRQGLLGWGRERLAASHYGWAKQHQATGQLDKALWDVNMATYMLPTFQDALQLRNQLLGKQIYESEFGSMRLFMRRLVEKDK
jgi:type IV pilus assembly protein PilQ